MKGHVSTPDELAEQMVRRLFRDNSPTSSDRILYPGCGTAPFAAAVENVCDENRWEYPSGLGVETNPDHLAEARNSGLTHVEFEQRDFLGDDMLDAGRFDYIVGNPPYVPIEELSETEKTRYNATFDTAVERFDLYLLFFERSLQLLDDSGILSFITPEKFEYVDTAAPLRRLLTSGTIYLEEIEHIDENAFTGLVTFPCVTVLRRTTRTKRGRETTITLRDGTKRTTTLPTDGSSWASQVRDADVEEMHTGVTLGDVTVRVSPGIATGADKVFVMNADDVPDTVDHKWVRPTVSGRELKKFDGPYTESVFICPYNDDGTLADEDELGATLDWLENHRDRLQSRSCVEKGKKWYAWHETPPMKDILRPKIVFRDIAKQPHFWIENDGGVIPKHSVYYAVPRDGVQIDTLREYLNSSEARMWMEAHCQKAHNGYYRLQSRVLSDLPVPQKWAETFQATL